MAKEVYRLEVNGQEHAWHGTPAALQKAYPGARITGRQVLNELGEGHWVTYSGKQASPVAEPEPAPETDADSAGESVVAEPAKAPRKTAKP